MLNPKLQRSIRNNLIYLTAVSITVASAPGVFAKELTDQVGSYERNYNDTASGAEQASQLPIYIAGKPSAGAAFHKKETAVDEDAGANEKSDGETSNDASSTADARAAAAAAQEAFAKQKAELAAWSHFDLAHHYQSRLDFELADTEFEQSVLSMPTVKIVHRDYCLLSLARLNLAKAIAEFMLATGLGEPVPYTPFEKDELDARAAKLHYRKALSYGRSNRWAPAIIELKWALSYAPKNPAIKRSLAFAYANAGKFEDAEQQYADSFAADPGDAYAHADFAFLLSEEGKGSKAVNQLSKAVELEPQVAALHIDLAWISEKNGDLERASKELQEAVKLSPKHAVLWAHLGRLLGELGKAADAKQAYSKAFTLDPQLAEAKEGLSKSDKANN
jgi:Flp pilus assembly protein TadD